MSGRAACDRRLILKVSNILTDNFFFFFDMKSSPSQNTSRDYLLVNQIEAQT